MAADETGCDEATWLRLKAAIEESRLSTRKRFREVTTMATEKAVTLLSLDDCKARTALRKTLVTLGFTVTEKRCPRSTAEWVPFPVLLLASGSGYYGRAAIEMFMRQELLDGR